jgi:hypothetical protein
MGEVVAGIALPDGEPGEAFDAASGFRAAAGGFERTGAVTERALGLVGSWQGMASISFRDRCGSYEEAAQSAAVACEQASLALRTYGRELDEARDRVRRIQREAEECVDRINAAEGQAAAARGREQAARDRAMNATFSVGLDAGSLSMADAAQALDDAAAAAEEARQADAAAAAARDRLEELRRRAEEERERIKEAGRGAATQVRAALTQMPTVTFPPPPAPVEEEEEDKPWYEDAWGGVESAAGWTGDQVVGLGKGFGEGVVGIGEGGLMLYRLSSINYFVDRDSYEREWDNVGQAAELAWNDPGAFAKAVVNWEDLADGRYGEWLGNLGPDAILAVATAGTGTAATRGLRAADTAGDVADAARDVDRATDAARAAPEGHRPPAPDHAPRPTWRQSEIDVGHQLGPGYDEQRSFLGGRDVPSGTEGSVRPDWYGHGEAIEVKNYDVESAAGRTRLVHTVGDQLVARTENLPVDTAQRVFVDIRGQELSIPDRAALAERIAARSGGAVDPGDIIFMEE